MLLRIDEGVYLAPAEVADRVEKVAGAFGSRVKKGRLVKIVQVGSWTRYVDSEMTGTLEEICLKARRLSAEELSSYLAQSEEERGRWSVSGIETAAWRVANIFLTLAALILLLILLAG